MTTAASKSMVASESPDGVLRSRDLEEQGVARQRLHEMVQRGEVIAIGRGLYQRADSNFTENHTLAQVCARVPNGVICLSSVLQFHNLTTQNPWQVWLMIERHAHTPKMDYPPFRIVRSGDGAFTEAVETHDIESVSVRVTCVAKTVVDCFKYRNKIGIDVALEALREALRDRSTDRNTLHHYAGICCVERVMRPYLEAMSL